ncbi:Hypothetical predicted protein [Olea europaea subsp. europaea]|uniref:Uncharacterized protein n=1 Tax=Olea europaea subsp. europaea TaxID=158383 RepID=A0A8S0PR13_OLEEU|nr:Hypothetical predicted protein [Olea europaea subsp. europaea]
MQLQTEHCGKYQRRSEVATQIIDNLCLLAAAPMLTVHSGFHCNDAQFTAIAMVNYASQLRSRALKALCKLRVAAQIVNVQRQSELVGCCFGPHSQVVLMVAASQ